VRDLREVAARGGEPYAERLGFCFRAPFDPPQTTATVTDIAPQCSGLPKSIPDANLTGINCTIEVPQDFKVLDVTLSEAAAPTTTPVAMKSAIASARRQGVMN